MALTQETLIADIGESEVLPPDLKAETIHWIRERLIVPGHQVLADGSMSEVIFAGSLDGPQRGHLYTIERMHDRFPEADVLVVDAVWKDKDYKLFSPVERAALLVSSDIIRHTRTRIILGCSDDPGSTLNLLSTLHQIVTLIVKGRRDDNDTKHTNSLYPKYHLAPGKILEIQCHPDLLRASSGEAKARLWAHRDALTAEDEEYLWSILTATVRNALEQALNRRDPRSNQIFYERLKHPSSEALFAALAKEKQAVLSGV